ncbi:MAG: pilus assembly PilX N-terminal domain-containing protein [Candidatus Sulfotelmatobacter sp.]
MRNRREQGMAMVTALLVLLLISAMIVGMSWLVLTDKKLGGNNADRQTAFYGAEAGMEALTTQLQSAFANNYALSAGDITTIVNNTETTTTNIPGVSYLAPDGTNGFVIQFTKDTAAGDVGNPLAQQHTILSGTYAGLVGLLTPYTMQVTARTALGSEARLQRTVQTVAIPVFQFGLFSDTDLDFFAGPDFNFGGRLHTNGNLWLAENGGTLTLAGKTTAVGQVIRTNLENGYSTASSYNTTVNITTNPGSSSYANLTTSQGSVTGTSYFGAVSTSLNEPAFKNLASATYNGNLGNGYTGVLPLNLTIATPALGGTPIDMIRMPLQGEFASNPGKLNERYYAKASLRILLSDYGTDGTCTTSDILNMPYASAGTPIDLAQLAWDTSSPAASAGQVAKTPGVAGLGGIGTTLFPMSVSAATISTAYTAADGYWVQKWFPIETGCLKIDFQSKTALTWTDVTKEILKLGWTGRNINPVSKAQITTNPPPQRVPLPGAQVNASGPTINGGVAVAGCADPSPNAVIRLSRLRDNPSTAVGSGGCTVAGTGAVQHGTDIWPNVLFDTREGTLRDVALAGNAVTLAGTMHYVELDVANLNKWFTGLLGASGTNANNTTGYTVYFSDRRGDRHDPSPPPSVGTTPTKTGAFGFDDFVNSSDVNGCPNGALEGAEDFESDFTSGTDLNPPAAPRKYGEFFPTDGVTTTNDPNLWNLPGNIGIQINGVLSAASTAILNNPTCAGPGKDWPFAVAANAQDLRENPSVHFRRGLKLVDGATLSIGTCDAVACGLTIVAENPIYVQGDYNAGINGNFATAFVAAAVIGDAVTLLSDNWNDVNSFAFPYTLGSRAGNTTTYRMAVVGGKTIPFKQPTVNCGGAACSADFGTDGGAHNFLRYIEQWSGTLYYKGSLVSLYYSHQGVGTFKCCTTVYAPPTRGYTFQTEFLTPSLLPPRTPMFQAINTIGFSQVVLPTQ